MYILIAIMAGNESIKPFPDSLSSESVQNPTDQHIIEINGHRFEIGNLKFTPRVQLLAPGLAGMVNTSWVPTGLSDQEMADGYGR